MSEDITFPRKWKEFSVEEQKDWIKTYFMPKAKIPEPIIKRDDVVAETTMRLKSGARIKIPAERVTVSKRNTNMVREFEFWNGKWLFTVFHNESMPHVKYIGVSNPSASKWIAQELSPEIRRNFYVISATLGHKYQMFQRKKPETRRKKPDFTLSLRDNRRGAF